MSGSGSSVALGSAGRPALLAPPTLGNVLSWASANPFAASLAAAAIRKEWHARK